MKKVSIITICRNSEATIEKTINSVLKQDYSNIEYIIIDGKSTDSTLSILKRSQNLKFISEEDSGIYNAMNKGIDLATGHVISFLNSDDTYISSDVVSKMMKKFNNGYEGVLCSNLIYNKSYSQIKIVSKIHKMKYNMTLNHPGSFLSSEIHKNNKFNENYKIAADYDLFLRLINQKVIIKSLDIYTCQMMSGGASSNFYDTTKDVFLIQRNYFGTIWALIIFSKRVTLHFIRKILR